MKIRSVTPNNRRTAFEVRFGRRELFYPYSRCEARPGPDDRVAEVAVDRELAREGFTYVLESGAEETVHVEQVLEYNEDPGYLREALLYRLTLRAERRVAASDLSTREIIRRMGTSATQFYRLLDPANRGKTIDQLVRLLTVLDCVVEVQVRDRSA